MRRQLFATLIICVTLLTQLGASIAGGPAAKDGVFANTVRCKVHSMLAAPSADPSAVQRSDGDTSPATHDHASCTLCQLGVGYAPIETAPAPALVVEVYWRIALAETEAPIIGFSLNRSAPARAPPAHA